MYKGAVASELKRRRSCRSLKVFEKSGCHKISVTLICVHGTCDIPENCRAADLVTAVALLVKSSSMPLRNAVTSFKLSIAQKFFRNANVFYVIEESCFIRAALALTNFFLYPFFGGIWSVQGLRSPVASKLAAMRVQVSFVIWSELPLRANLTDL